MQAPGRETNAVSGRERVAAVRRARERQTRIEAATVRVARAQALVQRRRATRDRVLAAAAARVAAAEAAVAGEISTLVSACGSTAYAAEILDLPERDVRRCQSHGTGAAFAHPSGFPVQEFAAPDAYNGDRTLGRAGKG